MRKRFFMLSLFMAMCFAGFSGKAQEVPLAEDKSNGALDKFAFGIVGGWVENEPIITMPTYADDMKYLKNSGATLGATVKYYFTNWLAARADLLWIQKNYKMNRTANNSASILNSDYTNNYFSLPVMAQVQFGYKFKVFAYFGGYVGYWMSGKRSGQTYSMDYLLYGNITSTEYDDEAWEFDSRRDNRFDAGLAYGLGVSLNVFDNLVVSVEGRYYYGMTDVQKQYMNTSVPHYNTTLAIQGGIIYDFTAKRSR